MARLPIPGKDSGTWGDILNDYLSQSHKSDGTLKADSVTATQIQDGAITESQLDSTVQTKINTVAPVTSVASKTGDVTLTKADVGLGNVDNTSDADKPVSTAMQTALDSKVDAQAVAGAANGTTDDRAAIAGADTVAQAAGVPVLFRKGTYRVASNLSITSPVILQAGAAIKPDNGVTVMLNGSLDAPLSQVFDHSAGGVVVPEMTDALHPAWWGQVLTSDDTQAWNDMLVAAAASSSDRTIQVPDGTSRLWEIDLTRVTLQCNGQAATIAPVMSLAVAADPTATDSGYVVKIGPNTSIYGGEWTADSVAGITLLYQTGARSFIDGAYLHPNGTDSTGILVYVSSGSLTPRILNTIIYNGGAADGLGIGIDLRSADAELTNVWVGQTKIGIEGAAAATLTAVHVWGCAETGIVAADTMRIVGCYIESNGGWGIDASTCDQLVISATRVWRNGIAVANTGGIKFYASGVSSRSSVLQGVILDDNTGTGLSITGVQSVDANVTLASTSVKDGGSAVCTTGVSVDTTSTSVSLRVRGSRSNVLTNYVLDDSGSAEVDLGTLPTKTLTSSVDYTSNTTYASISRLGGIAAKTGERYLVRGLLMVGGGGGGLKIRLRGTGSGDLGGAIGAVSSSANFIDVNTGSASSMAAAALGGSGGEFGVALVGTSIYQAIHIDAHIIVNNDTNINLQGAQVVSNGTASSLKVGTHLTYQKIM